jgi:integrase
LPRSGRCAPSFIWLAGQPGFRSHLSHADADYFNLLEKESRIAKASIDKPTPTLEQIRHMLSGMPATTPIEQRNRALIAFALLTGGRYGAIVSLKLKHLDLGEGKVVQDAREVKTKFSLRPGSFRLATTSGTSSPLRSTCS